MEASCRASSTGQFASEFADQTADQNRAKMWVSIEYMSGGQKHKDTWYDSLTFAKCFIYLFSIF